MNRSNVAERPPRANVSDIFRVWRDDKPADVNHLHAALLLALHEHRDAQPPEFDERSADRTWRVRSKAVESRAEESVVLTRFLAVLAHELRGPLTPILTSAELIARLPVGDPGLVRVQAIIRRQAAHLAHLIDDLLDVSRIRTGKLRLVCRPSQMADFIEPALDACRPAIAKRKQHLVVMLPSPPPVVHGDPVRLTQIFRNLLDNASKYTPEGGTLRLEAVVDEGSLVVTVADSGIGIAEEALDSVFEAFVQEERAMGVHNGGLGIGLSLVRELTEGHGGSVVARSDGVGAGSRFVVVLPLRPVR